MKFFSSLIVLATGFATATATATGTAKLPTHHRHRHHKINHHLRPRGPLLTQKKQRNAADSTWCDNYCWSRYDGKVADANSQNDINPNDGNIGQCRCTCRLFSKYKLNPTTNEKKCYFDMDWLLSNNSWETIMNEWTNEIIRIIAISQNGNSALETTPAQPTQNPTQNGNSPTQEPIRGNLLSETGKDAHKLRNSFTPWIKSIFKESPQFKMFVKNIINEVDEEEVIAQQPHQFVEVFDKRGDCDCIDSQKLNIEGDCDCIGN